MRGRLSLHEGHHASLLKSFTMYTFFQPLDAAFEIFIGQIPSMPVTHHILSFTAINRAFVGGETFRLDSV